MPKEFYSLPITNDTIILARELQRILDDISRRLNFMTPDGDNINMQGTKFVNLTSGTADEDSLRKDQVFLLENLASIILGTTDEITIAVSEGVATISLPGSIKLDGATPSRILATNASRKTVSTNLANWIAGTADELDIADDADGSVTLSISDAFLTSIVTHEGAVIVHNGEVVTK